jgi:hypothetical protein
MAVHEWCGPPARGAHEVGKLAAKRLVTLNG